VAGSVHAFVVDEDRPSRRIRVAPTRAAATTRRSLSRRLQPGLTLCRRVGAQYVARSR